MIRVPEAAKPGGRLPVPSARGAVSSVINAAGPGSVTSSPCGNVDTKGTVMVPVPAGSGTVTRISAPRLADPGTAKTAWVVTSVATVKLSPRKSTPAPEDTEA